MDFLDPDKMRRHTIMLYIGYGLVAIAITIATLVLLYQSYGFGINREGTVIQNGLVFTATRPAGAHVYIDGEDTTFTTSKRLILAAGEYTLEMKSAGYRTWARHIKVEGGSVTRYDYPVLFPNTLETSTIASLPTATASLATQSPDRRWVLLGHSDDLTKFDVYDLKNTPLQPADTITIPATVLTAPRTDQPQSLQLVEWSNDNQHVLLKHIYDGTYEYILLNRNVVGETLNLSTRLQINPTELRLIDKKYDRYYAYNQADKTLQRLTLSDVTPLDYLKNVLAYKSYGTDMMLYASDDTQPTTTDETDQVAIKLLVGDQTYTIRKVKAGTVYPLELAKYGDGTYIVAGSNTENRVYVYKNPVSQIQDKDLGLAVPVSTLRVSGANFVGFSDNTRFVLAENGPAFAVYDAEEEESYRYDVSKPLDAPQTHAEWMDGHRLEYVSGGKLYVFDYDHTNRQQLMAMYAGWEPFYSPDFKRVFSITPDASDATKQLFVQTWLLNAADR